MTIQRLVWTMAGAIVVALPAATARAQHDHAATPGARPTVTRGPTEAGQGAFAAIQEIVRMLEADSTTDWSKVNLEVLRQHLIDMNDVVLHARVAQRNVAGGFEADVTGQGRTVDAIRRILGEHSTMVEMMGGYHAAATPIPDGARFVVTARDSGDARMTAELRGLGVIGVLADGDHHPMHHLALARGEPMMHDRP
jgi:hypothetical protein